MSENLENKADYGAGNIQVLEGLEGESRLLLLPNGLKLLG